MFIIFRSLPLLHLAKLILPKELLWRKVSSFLMKAGIFEEPCAQYFLLLPSCYNDEINQSLLLFLRMVFWRCLSYCNTKLYHLLQTWIGNNECHLVISKYFSGQWNLKILLILMYSEGNNNVLVFENNREKSSINLQQLSC